jgi:nucleotide-binding universal stress UspA family protein
MASPAPDATARTAHRALAFRSVLCGVDGSASDAVAARQAAILAGPHGQLELVSVVERAVSESARIMLTPERARRALRQAHDVATDAGAHPREHVVEAGWGDTAPLLDRCEAHDLLVIGTHGGSRGEGILAGRTGTAAVHRATCPVLVARQTPEFPGTVLLADDGSGASAEAARLAAAIARQHGCETLVAAPELLDAAGRHRLAEHITDLAEATGRQPVIVDVEGDPARALPTLAHRLGVGLLILGSRRLQGVKALSSVSERVAHRAPCSVLVVRS